MWSREIFPGSHLGHLVQTARKRTHRKSSFFREREKLMNLSIFNRTQLLTALERYTADFLREADAGLLGAATCTHAQIQRIRAELDRRDAEV